MGKVTLIKAFLTYAENCRPKQQTHERNNFSYQHLHLVTYFKSW